MNFAAGYGKTNVDLLFDKMPRLPDEGEEIYTDKFSLCIGGGVPGTMITLSRLGVATKTVTELSDDMFSRFATEEFQKAGVEPVNVFKGKNIAVNITAAAITPKDRTFVSYGNEENAVDAEDVYNALKGAKAVAMHTGFPEVYERLKQEGTTVILDTGFYDDMTLEGYKKILGIADYFLPNRTEALKLTRTDDPREAAKILSEYQIKNEF